MTSVRPWRRSREAAFSHSWVKRWTSVSSGVSSRASASRRERSPGVDGLELCPVADQQHLRAAAVGRGR